MTANTAEKILESFPHPTIVPIIGQPTHETIDQAHLKLNANAASVHSHRGNGQLGLLYLTVQPDACNTLSDAPFDPPVNPGQHPFIPEGSAGPQAASMWQEHEDRFNEFLTYDQTDKALKSLLIAAVDEACIRSLRHEYVGYANVTTLTILNHLCDSYARVTPTDLEENNKRLKEACDPNQTFETLADQVEDAMEYAAAGKNPCTPKQIVNIAHALVFNTGVYNDNCKTWRTKPVEEQTWEAFKTFFTKANQDLRIST